SPGRRGRGTDPLAPAPADPAPATRPARRSSWHEPDGERRQADVDETRRQLPGGGRIEAAPAGRGQALGGGAQEAGGGHGGGGQGERGGGPRSRGRTRPGDCAAPHPG